MLYCRFQSGDTVGWGILQQHEILEVAPDIFADYEETGRTFPMEASRLLPPCQPSKIIAIGLNYKDHIQEFGRSELPSEPVMFLKAGSALAGFNDPIVLPAGVSPVDYEGELAVVMKKAGRRIPESEAAGYILGCTCLNDVTARALQQKDGQWARSKSFDSFAPVGPWIAGGLPFQNLRIETYLNGRAVQLGHTSRMIFTVPQLVAFVSGVMTLYPGDIISTGTPKGVGPLSPGDVVEIFVEGVGRLRNPVVAEK